MNSLKKRTSGQLHDDDLSSALAMIKDVPGDYAEIGIFMGHLFKRLILHAYQTGQIAYGFDSFVGMDDPGDRDTDRYPKGRFDVGGVDKFRNILEQEKYPEFGYQLYPGYIPDGFIKVPRSVHFAFVYVDVDHYQPTKLSAEWAFNRLVKGGVIGFDDYSSRGIKQASGAINEFMTEYQDRVELVMETCNHQIFFKKNL